MKTATPLVVLLFAVVVMLFAGAHHFAGFRLGQSEEDVRRARELDAVVETLRPLSPPLGEPGPIDWLAMREEEEQTFRQYIKSRPVRPKGMRDTIWIQPLGSFSENERRIVDLTASFLNAYFSCPVRLMEPLDLSVVPKEQRRVHDGREQIRTPHVLHEVLKPKLPGNAAAFIALTAVDLYPAEKWNFVFGQASLKERVGVWSMARFGDPDESVEAFRLCLLRTLKVATHETGHMFSLPHCALFECNMCGSNNLRETDRHPLLLCAECNAKVCWNVRADPNRRCRALEQFCRDHGLVAEADEYAKLLAALGEFKERRTLNVQR